MPALKRSDSISTKASNWSFQNVFDIGLDNLIKNKIGVSPAAQVNRETKNTPTNNIRIRPSTGGWKHNLWDLFSKRHSKPF